MHVHLLDEEAVGEAVGDAVEAVGIIARYEPPAFMFMFMFMCVHALHAGSCMCMNCMCHDLVN